VTDTAVYVNSGLSVTLHDDDRPTWEPDCLTLQQVRHDVQVAREMFMRRMGELDQVVAALAPLGPRAKRKEAGASGE
jgi:hypothetical protein